MRGWAIDHSTRRLSKCLLFFFSFQRLVEIKVWHFNQKPKITNIHSFPKLVCHKLLSSPTRRPYCVVGVSSSQYCDNCVRLGGVGGGLAIGKVYSWGINVLKKLLVQNRIKSLETLTTDISSGKEWQRVRRRVYAVTQPLFHTVNFVNCLKIYLTQH